MDRKRLIERIREIPEVELHDRIIAPLLAKRGATNIRNVHGPNERGKDFVFTLKEQLFGKTRLCVCQVKNTALSNREATHALEQVFQAKKTEVLNPVTKRKELPQEVWLITTYEFPELPDLANYIDQVRQDCEIIEPADLVTAMIDCMPQVCSELIIPGSGLLQSVQASVSRHQESGAFDLPEMRELSTFFVNLGIAPHNSPISAVLRVIRSDKTSNKVASLTALINATAAEFVTETAKDFSSTVDVTQPIEVPKKGQRETGALGRVKVSFENFEKSFDELADRLNSSEVDAKVWVDQLSVIHRLFDAIGQTFGSELWHIPKLNSLQTISEFNLETTTPSDVLHSSQNIAVVGGAGAGKTCFARTLAKQAIEIGKHTVFFPCAKLTDGDTDLESAIIKHLVSESSGISVSDAKNFVKQADLIILDGCDEASSYGPKLGESIRQLMLPSKVSTTYSSQERTHPIDIPDSIRSCFEVATVSKERTRLSLVSPISDSELLYATAMNRSNDFADRFTKIREKLKEQKGPQLVVTSRSIDSLEINRLMTTIGLQEFTDTQLESFFKRWLPSQKFQQVLDFVAKNENVKSICRNPMTATIVVSLALRGIELPRSRTEVYKRRFQLLLERWDRSRGVAPRNVLSPVDKLRFLAELALFIHQKHERLFNSKDVAAVWKQGFDRVPMRLSIDDFVEELIAVDNAVFREPDGMLSLGHLSLQEYLAAEAIVWGQRLSELSGKYSDPWWHGVMVYFVGITGDASKLLQGIQREFPIRNSEFIERLLQEARYTPRHVQDLVDSLDQDFGYDSDSDNIADDL